jgi:hypothetical protein
MGSISATDVLYIKDVAGLVQYSLDDVSYNLILWPFTIINSDTNTTLKVIFQSDIVLADPSRYFICGSSNIQFGDTSLKQDGTRRIIELQNLSDYPGLIQNGTKDDLSYDNIFAYNLRVINSGGTLATGGGWIGQTYFGYGQDTFASSNIFINCESSGDVPDNGGGICGRSTNVSTYHCVAYGELSNDSGGIFGPANYGYAFGCYTFGSIASGSGGIFGAGCFGTARNCYSDGAISDTSGGIFGQNTESGALATGCYSNGTIGVDCGGIFGAFSDGTAQNCYSTGSIDASGGGIFGASYLGAAQNCYTSGLGAPPKNPGDPIVGGIYADSSTDGVNNYSEAAHGNSGAWHNSAADGVLQNVNSLSQKVWFKNGQDIPYLLAVGCTPYSLQTVDGITPVDSIFFDAVVATSTSPVELTQYTTNTILYPSISGITMDNDGTINISISAPQGVYKLAILSQTEGPYLVTFIDLSISGPQDGGGGGGGTSVYNKFARSVGSTPGLVTEARGAFAVASSQNGKPLKFNSYAGFLAYKKAINDRS